ncbi:LamG domain-containing protein, partial [Patescibacteria group bacterium]|nr:LamG domain-containing protein [Patescibacteria group bacterium]
MKPLLGVQLNRSHPLAKGLVGCWVMNEGAGNKIYDLSGNGNDGSFPGGTANPLWKPGRTGPALKFDGVNDYVEKTSFTQITSAITISAWIYPNTYGSHANGLGRMVTGGLSGSAKYSFALNKDFSGLGTNNLIFNDGDEW